jgi:lysozyme
MKNNLSYSDKGLALTKQFEGLRINACQDSVGVWTIGYGHTGPDVHPKLAITEEQATQLLLKDVAGAVASVNHLVAVTLTQNQFDALVDFVFNVGAPKLANSTLLREINAGNFAAAAAQFPLWCHAGGVVLPGLLQRRKAAQALFLGHDSSTHAATASA